MRGGRVCSAPVSGQGVEGQGVGRVPANRLLGAERLLVMTSASAGWGSITAKL
jgi:hypothetical protein